VPVLVTLTDRVDAKRVYLFGVAATALAHLLFALLADGLWVALAARALAGIGWAGTYMTGLKLLADKVDAKLMSRAAAGHAASIGFRVRSPLRTRRSWPISPAGLPPS
jgi:MFS family permease